EYWELEQAKLAKQTRRSFDGQVAVVTGGASGIGRAAAFALAAQGAAVVTVDRNAQPREGPGAAVHVVGGLSDPAMPRQVAERAVAEFGGIDMLVSNVGILPTSKPIEAMDDETWARALDINVTSHQRMLTACVPLMRHGIGAAIVIVGSKNV